ncbi:substrate-binding domain-containing protein [Spirillospora sp. NPDC029432]|uniref:substrate-binding domain-containing protein n=1 Tax=Spirillospora sp. NPDC029432 TaxID=3154599 RepID=UPI003456C4AF
MRPEGGQERQPAEEREGRAHERLTPPAAFGQGEPARGPAEPEIGLPVLPYAIVEREAPEAAGAPQGGAPPFTAAEPLPATPFAAPPAAPESEAPPPEAATPEASAAAPEAEAKEAAPAPPGAPPQEERAEEPQAVPLEVTVPDGVPYPQAEEPERREGVVPSLPVPYAAPPPQVPDVVAAGPAFAVAVPEPAVAPGRPAMPLRPFDGPPRKRRRPPKWALVAAAGVLVAGGAGVAVAQVAGGCGGTVALNVAADPAVAPAVGAVARTFNAEKHEAGGGCVEVVASSVPSPGMVVTLGGDRGGARADAYVLDSSLWLTVVGEAARRTGAAAPVTVGPVAESPVVFALPKGSPKDALSWSGMASGTGRHALRIAEPQQNASGMAALLMARQAAGNGEKALAGFTRILQGGQGSVAPHAIAALENLGARSGGQVPVAAVPEQAVWAMGGAVDAVMPADRTVSMDFPMVAASKGKAAAAREFAAAMRSAKGRAELAKVGLRAPGAAPAKAVSDVTGVTAVAGAARPRPQALGEVLEMWRRMRLGTRMLALIDVSGSMNETVPGTGRTRMAVTAGEVNGGMALLPDAAEVGVWTFSTRMNGALPYKELTPMGRLGAVAEGGTHRAALQQTLGGMRAKPDGDTGLHDSVLAAFRAVKAGYRDDMLNFVLVLTDGRNDFAGGISEQKLLAELKKEYDPARPVQVIGLAFGPAVDLPALQRIATATGGAAYQIQDPRQIRELFRRSAALKICDDPRRCPAG